METLESSCAAPLPSAKRGLLAWLVAGLMGLCITASPALAHAAEYPEFSEAYWQRERDKAEGKRRRGIGLGVAGLGSIALTAFLIKKAVDDPQRYMAGAMVSGIATLGMTLHGFSSVAAGKQQRAGAEAFIGKYQTDPSGSFVADERAHFIALQSLSSKKFILFGSVLALQSAILLTHGAVLSVRKRKGADLRGAKIWPAYLVGGLFLPAAGAIIVTQSRRLVQLNRLEAGSSRARAAFSLQPYFQLDRGAGHLELGAMGHLRF